jgi:hypothetical protein
VLRIHDILVWIRIQIRGSRPLTNGSRFGSGSFYNLIFIIDLQDANKKKYKTKFCILFFECTFTSFFKDKKSKRSHKTVEIKVFFTIFYDRRIRIRTSDQLIRIQEAQKHVDPDSDLDPQHCSKDYFALVPTSSIVLTFHVAAVMA